MDTDGVDMVTATANGVSTTACPERAERVEGDGTDRTDEVDMVTATGVSTTDGTDSTDVVMVTATTTATAFFLPLKSRKARKCYGHGDESGMCVLDCGEFSPLSLVAACPS